MRLELAPNHLVDNSNVALDDLDHLGADILVDVVGNGKTMVTIVVHIHSALDCLEERLLVDTCDEEATLVEGFRALGRGSDADCWEGMTNAGEETGLLGKSA